MVLDFPLPESTVDSWLALRPGTMLTVVKLAPDGSEAARYPGEVARGLDPDGWIVVHATWTHRAVELDGLEFRGGDHLVEWFSPRYPLNAFQVLTATGDLKGWYANVTHPAHLDLSTDPPVLFWHDLYVDLVGLPDKTYTIRDDDELEASRLNELDPRLYQRILWARTELIQRFEQQLPPFVEVSQAVGIPAPRVQAASGR